jgi:PAS domain S-box-containing protein
MLNQIEEPKPEAQLLRRARASLAVAVIVMGALGILSWRIAHQAAQNADWVAHTYEVIGTMERTLRHLDDVETGARGFAMTGQNRFLEPYISGLNATRLDLEKLRTLLSDNPGQERRLDGLADQAKTRLEAAADLVKARRYTTKVPDAAYLDKGKEVMDKIRASTAGIEDQEKLLLEQRTQRARNTRRLTGLAIGLGSILGIVFLFIAGLTVNRGIRIAAKAQTQLKALNADLEERVEQRTATLQAETAARLESEGRLEGVIASAMDSIITVDDEQHIVMFNRAAEKMLRCLEHEALGQPITRFIPQRFHAAYAGHILKFGELGVTNRAMGSKDVLWARRADGQEFQIEASISQVVAGGKKLFTVILRDVSERMQAQQAVLNAQARMSGIVASAMDAIITVDSQQRIEVFNVAATTIFRCSAAEAIGQSIERFIPQRFRSAHATHIRQFGETGTTNRAMGQLSTLWAVRAGGEEFPIEASISQIEILGQKIFTVILRDVTERKLKEEALRESETNFGVLVNLVPQFVWICTNEGLNIYFNERWLKYTGLTLEESYGTGWNAPFHPEEKQRAWDAWNQATATGDTYIVESRIRAADGSYRWFLMRGEPVRAATGGIVKWFGTCTDIHEMKQAQEALRESEERFQALANGIPQLAWMAEADGSIFWYNQRWYDYTGTTLGETRGWTWDKTLDPAFLPKVLDRWREAIATATPFDMEIPLRGADGRFRMFLSRAMPVRNSEGRVVRWMGTNTDSTDSEARYRGLLEAAPDAMVVVSKDGGIVLLNVQAEKQFGYQRDELLGQKVTRIIPEGFAERLIADGTRTPAEALVQQIGTGIELSGRRKDGSRFPIEIMLSPLESADGILVTAAIRNISARNKSDRDKANLRDHATALQAAHNELELRVKERTLELAASNQILERSNIELQQFAYVASHDLQSPLRNISGFVELLHIKYEGKLDEQADDWIRRTIQATVQMQALIKDLLAYSRVDSRLRPFVATPFIDVFNDAVGLLESAISDAGAQVTCSDLPVITGDRSQLVQLLDNLIGNGLKYRSDKAPRVHLSAKRNENEWTFSVCDNGIGIAPEYRERIFEIFQRLHDKKDYPGTGIGLAVCRRIVSRHGGRIWADSETGQGSAFHFTIPAEQEATQWTTNIPVPDQHKSLL